MIIHREVTLTMAKIRSENYILSLEKLMKKVIKACCGCKVFSYQPVPKTINGTFARKAHQSKFTIQNIGTYYTGSLLCKTKGGKETKVYILSFTRSLTRAIHLELLPSQSTQEFIMPLK